MATSAEFTFAAAVRTAEGVRQVAKQSAFATFQAAGFSAAAFATYAAALVTADDTYITSVNAANNVLLGYTTPNSGTPNQAIVGAGNLGISGVSAMSVIGNATATMGSIP